MKELIAVVEFAGCDKQYEYLAHVADNASLEELKFAVTLPNSYGADNPNKSMLNSLKIVFIRKFKELSEKSSPAELQRVVLCFSVEEFVAYANKRKKIAALRETLERRVSEMSIFEKIAALGVKDPTITSMAAELKNLMEGN